MYRHSCSRDGGERQREGEKKETLGIFGEFDVAGLAMRRAMGLLL